MLIFSITWPKIGSVGHKCFFTAIIMDLFEVLTASVKWLRTNSTKIRSPVTPVIQSPITFGLVQRLNTPTELGKVNCCSVGEFLDERIGPRKT
jgi:hypothetical protein